MSGVLTHAVGKSFGRGRAEKKILIDFSFCAPSGSATLLAGLNGAGKTTWLRIALGLTAPDAGHVSLDGRPAAQARRSLAVVFDEPPVYPHMSGLMNLAVMTGCSPASADWSNEVRRVLGLTDSFLGMKGRQYSLGQRRRLAVGAALIRRPTFLFLDEPTVGLDPSACHMLLEAIRRIVAEGAAVVLTGQDFDEAAKLADRVVVLHRGTNVFEGTVAEFTSRRPPQVRVVTRAIDKVIELFPDRTALERHDGMSASIPCSSVGDAESVVADIQRLGLPVEELKIQHDTLEESFTALLAQDEEGRA
ncbi:MAG: ABC transporter ATP-binding protein [Actinobacteria bacterium]|jgi:ABC-type multidrug transport system ATPase subunit|nr:ABC transporter ATP-binding protein [Actinomycetota bacterium]